MAAARVRSLDVEHAQVLIDFFDDPEFSWHHRLLVVDCGGGRWIAVTPDHEVEVLVLNDHRVLPVGRAGRFPQRALRDMYVFDPIAEDDMRALENECLALARVLGLADAKLATGVAHGQWRISDPALADFDKVIPDAEMMNPDTGVARETAGVHRFRDAKGVLKWIHVERVLPEKHAEWRDQKQSGPGRDLRIASNFRDATGKRHASLATSLSAARDTTFADWPYRGPKAAPETLTGVLKSGNELSTYDMFWSAKSGIAKQSAVAQAHRNIFAALYLFQSYDQYDMLNSAGVEFLVRWALMIQTATRKNPKVPNFHGLDSFLSYSFDEAGGVVTSSFAKFVAEEQKAEAVVLKQHRLWQEEVEADEKRRREKGGKDNKNDREKGKAAGAAGGKEE